MQNNYNHKHEKIKCAMMKTKKEKDQKKNEKKNNRNTMRKMKEVSNNENTCNNDINKMKLEGKGFSFLLVPCFSRRIFHSLQ